MGCISAPSVPFKRAVLSDPRYSSILEKTGKERLESDVRLKGKRG
jgi:hypothetical protein